MAARRPRKPNDDGHDGRDEPLVQTLRVVDVIDCVPGNTPDAQGRPISIVTLAHLGEIEQSLAVSYADTKRLVTKLLQSLAAHGNAPAEEILERYFVDLDATNDEGGRDDDDGGGGR